MSDLVKVSIALTAVSLGLVVYNPAIQSVCAFAVSSALFGFITFIERKNRLEVERFEADIKRLNDTLSALSIGMGWKT